MPEVPTLLTAGATGLTGLLAGVYVAFAISVMPGLRAVADRTLLETMRRINVAILNPWFLTVFLGAPLVTGVAAALRATGGGGPAALLGAAFALHVVGFAVTVAGNVPLNNALAAGTRQAEGEDDAAQARARFEGPWTRWNTVRAVASVGAFACLIGALALPTG